MPADGPAYRRTTQGSDPIIVEAIDEGHAAMPRYSLRGRCVGDAMTT
jgi:hypothetical protein